MKIVNKRLTEQRFQQSDRALETKVRVKESHYNQDFRAQDTKKGKNNEFSPVFYAIFPLA